MDKITGQKLKKDILATKTKLHNLQDKANKRFHLIMNDYPQYIPEPQKTFLQENSYLDLDYSIRLDIVIATEAEYVKQTGNQLDFFN